MWCVEGKNKDKDKNRHKDKTKTIFHTPGSTEYSTNHGVGKGLTQSNDNISITLFFFDISFQCLGFGRLTDARSGR